MIRKKELRMKLYGETSLLELKGSELRYLLLPPFYLICWWGFLADRHLEVRRHQER